MMNPNLIAPKDDRLELPKLSTIDLLQSWIDGEDAEDQKETGDYLVKTLDEDRSSLRELFPSELELRCIHKSFESIVVPLPHPSPPLRKGREQESPPFIRGGWGGKPIENEV